MGMDVYGKARGMGRRLSADARRGTGVSHMAQKHGMKLYSFLPLLLVLTGGVVDGGSYRGSFCESIRDTAPAVRQDETAAVTCIGPNRTTYFRCNALVMPESRVVIRTTLQSRCDRPFQK